MRHDQSEWNARNLFTGWADPDLTATGEREAALAGRLPTAHGLLPGLAHTSLQRRAIGDDEIAGLEIPNGVPLFYQLDPCTRPLTKGGRRLAG